MPLVVAGLSLTLYHQPFAQVVEPPRFQRHITVRFNKARPVLDQVIAMQ